jgi:hypothetical protein
MTIKQLEIKGLDAVRMLRRKKLNSGVPFMIFAPSLPSHHCLLEFPDGTIKEATINKKINDYIIVRELSFTEAEQFRKKYKLD